MVSQSCRPFERLFVYLDHSIACQYWMRKRGSEQLDFVQLGSMMLKQKCTLHTHERMRHSRWLVHFHSHETMNYANAGYSSVWYLLTDWGVHPDLPHRAIFYIFDCSNSTSRSVGCARKKRHLLRNLLHLKHQMHLYLLRATNFQSVSVLLIALRSLPPVEKQIAL